MPEFAFDDVVLTYEIRGRGEPVVLIHACPFVAWYEPLVERLSDFSTLTYRRTLRTTSPAGFRSLTVAEDAAICTRLMAHLGWPKAHVVGHSYGALVALQLAVGSSDLVQSLVLLEPAARGVSSGEQAAAALQPVLAAYRAGDKVGAIDGFLRTVCGDGYRSTLDQALPEAFDTAVADADQFFQAEMSAVQQFSFGPDDAQRISPPVLNVGGSDSVGRFIEVHHLVQSWFPRAERLSVPRAGHLLMVENPAAVAQGLREFFSRHPMTELGAAGLDT